MAIKKPLALYNGAFKELVATDAIGPTQGGTGLGTYAVGDILYASATNTLAKLAATTNGYVLTLSGGLPVWAAAAGGGGSVAGSDTQIQFNNAGAFGADSTFLWNNTTKNLAIGGTSKAGTASRVLIKSSDNTGATPSLAFFRPDAATGVDIFYDGTVNSLNFKYNVNGTLTNVMSVGQLGFSLYSDFTMATGNLTLNAGNIRIPYDYKLFLRELNEWYLGYNTSSEQIRISTRDDGTSRFINFGVTTTASVWTSILSVYSIGKNVGIGIVTPANSSLLDLTSTTKGFLSPRMTTTQKNAISSPAEGLEVYDLTLHKKCVYTGSVWETVTSS